MGDSAELQHSYQYLEAQTSFWFYSYFWKMSTRKWNVLVESNVLDALAGGNAPMVICWHVLRQGKRLLSLQTTSICVGGRSPFNTVLCHQKAKPSGLSWVFPVLSSDCSPCTWLQVPRQPRRTSLVTDCSKSYTQASCISRSVPPEHPPSCSRTRHHSPYTITVAVVLFLLATMFLATQV